MDQYENEIHHIQFLDAEGEIPATLTILVRQKKGVKLFGNEPITQEDVTDIKEELQSFDGNIIPFLKRAQK